MLIRSALTDCMRRNGWSDMVIPRYRCEARYARSVVKAVVSGIVRQTIEGQVRGEVSFRGASDDPKALFGVLDQLAPVQAVREEGRGTMKKRQECRGTGDRMMGVGRAELGLLEAAASGPPSGGLMAKRSWSRSSGPTQGGVTEQRSIFSGDVGNASTSITAMRAEAGATRGESSDGQSRGNRDSRGSVHYGLPGAPWGP